MTIICVINGENKDTYAGLQSGSRLVVREIPPNRSILDKFSPHLEREEREVKWVDQVGKGPASWVVQK